MGEKGRAVRLGAALALQLCALWGTGTFWYFRTSDPAFDALPTVGMVVMCACLLGLGLASASSATLGRHARTCSTAACVAAPCSALVALAGGGFAQTGDAVGLALAVLCCLASWACNAFSLLACAGALTSLGLSARIAAVVCAAVCAVAPRSLARLAVDAGQGVMLFIASMLMCAAACALARRESCALFERTTQASEAPADVQLTQPATFLPLGHGLYLLLGVFGFAAGMSFFFGIDADFAHVSALSIAPLALIALVGLRVRSRVSLDALHIASFVIAAGAFLSIGFVWDESIVVSGALFGAAEACFYVLMFTLLAAIAQRNERNASVVFGWGLGLFALGWGVCGSASTRWRTSSSFRCRRWCFPWPGPSSPSTPGSFAVSASTPPWRASRRRAMWWLRGCVVAQLRTRGCLRGMAQRRPAGIAATFELLGTARGIPRW